ncbi:MULTISPECIES: hypothetical protein [Photorhabdus]|nr:hypothetical protein [Photorhabdus asymbiotica]
MTGVSESSQQSSNLKDERYICTKITIMIISGHFRIKWPLSI